MMMQTGLLDWQTRFKQLDMGSGPPHIQRMVDWKRFRPLLEVARDKERKFSAGRKPFHVVLMFKVLRDRVSFIRLCRKPRALPLVHHAIFGSVLGRGRSGWQIHLVVLGTIGQNQGDSEGL